MNYTADPKRQCSMAGSRGVMAAAMANSRAPAAAPEPRGDINSYSIDQLLELFNITLADLTPYTMKSLKQRVLMLHPDKSKMSAEYYMFYRSAYERILDIYKEMSKHEDRGSAGAAGGTEYDADKFDGGPENNSAVVAQIYKQTQSKDFNKKFNEIFEKEMMSGRARDESSHEWFKSESSALDVPEVTNMKQMEDAIEAAKRRMAVARYTGDFRGLSAGGAGASNLYEDSDTAGGPTAYYSGSAGGACFDDIRRVHRDETIIPVSAAGADPRRAPSSMDEYRATREAELAFDAAELARAEREYNMNQERQKQAILEKQFQERQRTEENAKKKETILGYFLRLGQ